MPQRPKGRPPMKNPKIINKGFKTDKETIEKIEKYAKQNNLTFSKVIQIALESFLREK